MSEGGQFPWKVQNIFRRGPTADYSNLRKPLPPPPKGQSWIQDKDTKEWTLVSAGSGTGTGGSSSSNNNKAAEILKTLVEDLSVVCDDSSVDHRVVTDTEQHPSPPPRAVVTRSSSEDNENNDASNSNDDDDDWEEVAGTGSVRSLPSQTSHSHSQSNNINSGPIIQRQHSSSTIDSSDVVGSSSLGPYGKGILGVDYVEHVVLPSDTFQGICLAYKIQPTKLRQANHFSGTSLTLAPKRLVIPVSSYALQQGFLRVQDTASKEYKVHAFMAQFPDLSTTEATAYLELSDWNLPDAIHSADEDNEWEQDVVTNKSNGNGSSTLRSGQIRITTDPNNQRLRTNNNNGVVGNNGRVFSKHDTASSGNNKKSLLAACFKGAGIANNNKNTCNDNNHNEKKVHDDGDDNMKEADSKSNKNNKKQGHGSRVAPASFESTSLVQMTSITAQPQVQVQSEPFIATKSVQPQDILHATPQHANFGVEMQSLLTEPLLPPRNSSG